MTIEKLAKLRDTAGVLEHDAWLLQMDPALPLVPDIYADRVLEAVRELGRAVREVKRRVVSGEVALP